MGSGQRNTPRPPPDGCSDQGCPIGRYGQVRIDCISQDRRTRRDTDSQPYAQRLPGMASSTAGSNSFIAEPPSSEPAQHGEVCRLAALLFDQRADFGVAAARYSAGLGAEPAGASSDSVIGPGRLLRAK